MKPAHARHRVDTGAADRIGLLLASGLGYVPLGGAIDGAVYLGNTVALVDFKAGAKSKRTKTQIAMVAKGVPLWFLASDADVLRLATWMRAAREQAAQ
jgi:hypothetical protein